jgi:D-glycero-D-manno-heptose 1,7-bisphosphate phosphatase
MQNAYSSVISSASERAIFFDRDGTLSEEVGYVNHLSRFRLLPSTVPAIRRVNEAGWRAILVTNQAGVARGYFDEWLIHDVHAKLQAELRDGGAHLDAVYFCAHHPTLGQPPYRLDCECRKPKPGMLLRGAREFGLDLTHCFVVGDRYSDVKLAHRVGAKGVFVLTGYGLGEYEYQRNQWDRAPDHVAENALAAVEWILAQADQPSI